MKNVLIAIDEFANASTRPVEILESAGFNVILNDTGDSLDYKNHVDLFKQADYVIAGLESYSASFFEKFSNVNAISRVGVGVDCIDIISATKHGVKIFITSDKPSVAVAELCVSNMISLLRHTFNMSNNLKAKNWKPIQGRELRSCTVGVIGVGSIGKQVIRRVHAFGSELIGYGRTWDEGFANKFGVIRKTMQEIFEESDVITIHLPLTPETKGIISSEIIGLIKPGAIILNTSRAGIIDNIALVDSINKNIVYGAAMDVFDEERDPYPYGDLDEVILTPHIGSHTIETRKSMEEMAAKNIVIYDSLTTITDATKISEILLYIEKHSVSYESN